MADQALITSRRHSRRGLVGGSTFRRTLISRAPLDKNPMPGHLSELQPVNAVNEESTVESVLNFRYRKAVLFFLLGMSFPVNVCKAPTNWGGFSSWKVFSFEKGGKLVKPAWLWAPVDLPVVRLASGRKEV